MNKINIELAADAIGITDSLNHDKDSGYLIDVIRNLAKIKNLPSFDAAGASQRLFDFFASDSIKKSFSEKHMQCSLVPVEEQATSDSQDTIFLLDRRIPIPREIALDVKNLGLCFVVEVKKPSLNSQWDDKAAPKAPLLS